MLDNILNNNKQYDENAQVMSSEFFANVYSYMFIGLSISGTLAYLCGSKEFFIQYFMSETGAISPLFWVVIFAPVGLALWIQMGYNRLSLGFLYVLYGIYAALMGLSLSTIFLVYDIGSIVSTFFVTAGAFAAMAILGYTTKTDLSRLGSILYMLFFGVFIAAIVNIFVNSDMVGFGISLVGVFIFTGLTAFEMQNLKYIAQDPTLANADKRKLSLIGGLKLYILFINLFMSLLRLMGSRD